MAPLGYFLLAIGAVVELYGDVRFLVVARHHDHFWFFGCLFLPPVALLFFLLNLKATIKPVGLSLLGFLMAGLGCWLAGIDPIN